ncbi:TPA: hypothetical protein ACS72K_000707 [Providencia alcalifaciens]|uniref:hypothetical protein n=1 Tax=Providencia alcalifaciens TaxID=126385 RepID=UPI002B05B5E6|nr:hypothetical protein [Providencia alcalifaciens]
MKQFYLCLLLCFSAPLYANEVCEKVADLSTAEVSFYFSAMIVKDKAYFYYATDDTFLVVDVSVISGGQVSGKMEEEVAFLLSNYYAVSDDNDRNRKRNDRG